MHVLVAGDIHYNLRQFDWIIDQAPHYDLVIVAGDLLDIAGHCDMDTQILVATKYLHRLAEVVPTLVCSGNHDGCRKDEHDEFIAHWLRGLTGPNLYVDGASLTLNGWLFSVCPWWDGPVSQQEVADFLNAEAKKPRANWCVVHHAPPSESPTSWTGKKDVGDEQLRALIDQHQPNVVVSGHVHGAPFRNGGSWNDQIGKTWVFNAGRQIGDLPACFNLDLDNCSARWLSLAGAESVELAG